MHHGLDTRKLRRQVGRGAANLGIDFAGGTAVQLKFDKPVRISELKMCVQQLLNHQTGTQSV